MICDNCIHNAVCERAHFENHCGYKHTEADVIIPELDKIMAELLDVFINDKNCEVGLSFATDLIDEHISKLKEGDTDADF